MKNLILIALASVLILTSCARDVSETNNQKVEPFICWMNVDGDYAFADSIYNGLKISVNLPVGDWKSFVELDDYTVAISSQSMIDSTEKGNFLAFGFDTAEVWSDSDSNNKQVAAIDEVIVTMLFGKDTVKVWGHPCYMCE